MVYNDKVLFIHIGKTGGTSAANYLCKTLDAPVFNVIPEGDQNVKSIGHETTLKGRRHATLEEAKTFLKTYKKGIKSFEKIYAVIRNPYLLEISLFNYYTKLYKSGAINLDKAPRRKKAIENGVFDAFVKEKFYHRNNLNIRKYITIDNKIPENVSLIKFEELQDEFLKIGETYGNGNKDFPYLNKSKKGNIRDLITPELELIIYRKYKWVFQVGNYERLKF